MPLEPDRRRGGQSTPAVHRRLAASHQRGKREGGCGEQLASRATRPARDEARGGGCPGSALVGRIGRCYSFVGRHVSSKQLKIDLESNWDLIALENLCSSQR